MSTFNFNCNGNLFQIFSPPHHISHEWSNGVPPEDAVTVHPRMFALMRGVVVKGSVLIKISPFYYIKNNEFKVVGETTFNTTPYLAPTANKVRLAVVGFNFDTEVIEAYTGEEMIFSALTPPPLPTGLPDSFFPSFLVRLRYNATELFETDITDARFAIQQTGALSVGAASESAAGIAELATQTEVDTGTDDARIVTPLKLKSTPIDYFRVSKVYSPTTNAIVISTDDTGGVLIQYDLACDSVDTADITATQMRCDVGGIINEFSTDGTMAGNSDSAVPTEKAVKTYVDAQSNKGVAAYHNTNQSISNGVDTSLALNSERRDDAGFHDTSTNNSRLTVPTGYAGWYQISGNVQFASNATGLRQTSIMLNGTTYLAVNLQPAVNGAVTVVAVATLYYLNDGDYVELRAYQTSTGNLNVEAAGNYSPELRMVRI